LRLLYVGLTRARDQLVLVLETEQPATWLDTLEAPWLQAGAGTITLPDSTTIASMTEALTPPTATASAPADPAYAWFPASVSRTAKKPARLIPSDQLEMPASSIGQIIDLGGRLPFSGSPDETDLGNALHAIFSTEFLNPDHPGRLEAVDRILGGYELRHCLKSHDIISMVDRLRRGIEASFKPRRTLVEVPIEVANCLGQRIEGVVDLLLDTDLGWVLIDHKSFPGKRPDWPAKARSYSGQMALYQEGLARLNVPLASMWIHFAVGGGLVEILPHGNKRPSV